MIACLLSCLVLSCIVLTFSISDGCTSVDRQKLNKITSYNKILFQIPASQGDSALANGTANGVNPAGSHTQTQQGIAIYIIYLLYM
jgi:hypothetical protein